MLLLVQLPSEWAVDNIYSLHVTLELIDHIDVDAWCRS